MFYLLFFFLIGLPVLEIWILIQLGNIFGFWGTLLLVIGTAILGIFHLRMQGFELVFNLQKKLLYNHTTQLHLILMHGELKSLTFQNIQVFLVKQLKKKCFHMMQIANLHT